MLKRPVHSVRAGVQHFTWIAEFNTIRLGHVRSDRGCIEWEANGDDQFKMTSINQSITIDRSQATNGAITIDSR